MIPQSRKKYEKACMLSALLGGVNNKNIREIFESKYRFLKTFCWIHDLTIDLIC